MVTAIIAAGIVAAATTAVWLLKWVTRGTWLEP